MYNFHIEYSNRKAFDMENVVKVEYCDYGGDVVVTGEELLTHQYPLGFTLRLYSDSRSYTTDGESIVGIEVVKAD